MNLTVLPHRFVEIHIQGQTTYGFWVSEFKSIVYTSDDPVDIHEFGIRYMAYVKSGMTPGAAIALIYTTLENK
jgi:hypothetical protein